ncbi:hypothetical protein Nepgr_019347 [Nepenthes gracilis]|uniref:Uncharacterized protein n=1 Tax=Nepenthes gracilis TaxID=150966 RepID=A0AAD3XV83_NEPGR|nr:hypothetical protein Nepgr_019347 [Nepenthes gracilis]
MELGDLGWGDCGSKMVEDSSAIPRARCPDELHSQLEDPCKSKIHRQGNPLPVKKHLMLANDRDPSQSPLSSQALAYD